MTSFPPKIIDIGVAKSVRVVSFKNLRLLHTFFGVDVGGPVVPGVINDQVKGTVLFLNLEDLDHCVLNDFICRLTLRVA